MDEGVLFLVAALLAMGAGLAGYLAYLGRRADVARRSLQGPATGRSAQTQRLPASQASPTPPQPGSIRGGYEPAAEDLERREDGY